MRNKYQRGQGYTVPRTGDTLLDRSQDAADKAFKNIDLSSIIDGRLVVDVELELDTDNVVLHGLGRAPRGYVIVKRSHEVTVWDSDSPNARPEMRLFLKANVASTVTLWVF